MKYSEFHRWVRANGWVKVRQKGSHVSYEKDGQRYPVPDHGAKEMPERLRLKIIKQMKLK